jgi:NADPH:quinone reductase-like Zn-dependent oxidoreductase
LGLYDKLGMPMPGSQKTGEGQWLLVYGGSTAMGTFAIQCAVL